MVALSLKELLFERKLILQCQRKENIENVPRKIEVHRKDKSDLLISKLFMIVKFSVQKVT